MKDAETAEELMRSRFSAYCLRQVKYIVETTHPDSAAAKGSWYNGKQVSTLKVLNADHLPCSLTFAQQMNNGMCHIIRYNSKHFTVHAHDGS